MAKRFIDTEIFKDEWFTDLPINSKLAWIYFFTTCDHAGVFKINEKLFEFQTGIKGFAAVMKDLQNRLITVKPGIFFIPKFIAFQYPNGLNTQVSTHKGVIKRLEEYDLINEGVIKGLYNTSVGIKDKDKDKDIKKEKERAKKIFDKCRADEAWLDLTCKGMALPFSREKSHEFILDKLHSFLASLAAGEGLRKTDDETLGYFIGYTKKNLPKDEEYVRFKNLKK